MSGKRTFEEGPGQNLDSICRAVKRLHTYSPDLEQDQQLSSSAAANVSEQLLAAQPSADAAATVQPGQSHAQSQPDQHGNAALQQLRLPQHAAEQGSISERRSAAVDGQRTDDVAGPSTPIRDGEGSSGIGYMTAEELRNYEQTNVLLKELHFERLRRLTIHE